MPISAARPCRHPGCVALVRDGSGYCSAHQEDRKLNTFADPARGTRQQRGYGSSWDKARVRILRRDKGLCQPCLKAGRVTPARQVDHITAKSAGGTDTDTNLQAICIACHKVKTATESAASRRGV